MSPYLRLQRLLQSQLRMTQTVKPDFFEESLLSLFYLSFSKPNLLVNARVKRERANFFKHRHALILLNIARRYRMDHHSIWKRSINQKGNKTYLKPISSTLGWKHDPLTPGIWINSFASGEMLYHVQWRGTGRPSLSPLRKVALATRTSECMQESLSF